MQFSICPIDDPRKLPNTFLSKLVQTSLKSNRGLNRGSFTKRDMSGTSSDNEWQRVVQQVTTNENECYNEWQQVTTNDN